VAPEHRDFDLVLLGYSSEIVFVRFHHFVGEGCLEQFLSSYILEDESRIR